LTARNGERIYGSEKAFSSNTKDDRMSSKFIITLFNPYTEQFCSREKEFITFEEATQHANKERHKLGHAWQTTSIVKVMKGKENVNTTPKVKHNQ